MANAILSLLNSMHLYEVDHGSVTVDMCGVVPEMVMCPIMLAWNMAFVSSSPGNY